MNDAPLHTPEDPIAPRLGVHWGRWVGLAVALCLMWIGPTLLALFGRTHRGWGNRAKLTLRVLGSSELAYRDEVHGRHYGTWDDLVATDYVQKGYTRGNIVDNYSLAVFYIEEGSSDPWFDRHASFTIVAVPRRGYDDPRTFAICDDQTVRVATNHHLHIVPNRGNDPPTGDNPCEWDALH